MSDVRTTQPVPPLCSDAPATMDPADCPTVRLPKSNLQQLGPAEADALRRQLDGHVTAEIDWWASACGRADSTAFGRAHLAGQAAVS